jgi:hypothetical protein
MALRWLLGGSYVLFNFLLIALLWRNRWLSHTVGLAVLMTILVGWAITVFLIFRHLGMSTRQKVVGSIFFVAICGFTVARQFASYSMYHDEWTKWLFWDAVGMLSIFSAVLLSRLITGRKNDLAIGSDSYTVESQMPEHVFHVDTLSRESDKQDR